MLRVYQELGRLVRLPVRVPQGVIDDLVASASPTDLEAAGLAAGQVLAALQQVIDGRPVFPPWPEDTLPVEESLPIIEAALAQGQALELDYYTAGRDELTHRLVEPYRLEWRGPAPTPDRESDPSLDLKLKTQTPYLIGFCHRAQSERTFRLDRIYSVVKVPWPGEFPPGSPGVETQGW